MLDKLSSQKICFAYTLAYLVLSFLIFITFTTHSTFVSLCSYAVATFGAIIIVACIIKRKFKVDWILISSVIFIISCAISSFAFSKFGGLSTNIKGIVWLTMELILILNVIHVNYSFKLVQLLIKIYISISTVIAIFSLGFAILGYGHVATFIGENNFYMGMLSGRLYGMYSDPYYGSVISVLAILGSIFVFKKKFIYTILLSIPHLFVIALSGSRTTFVIFCVGGAVLVFFLLWQNKKVLSIIFSVFTALAIVIVTIGFTNLYSALEPYILTSLDGSLNDPSQIFPVEYANKVNNALDYSTYEPEFTNSATPQSSDGQVQADNVGMMGRNESKDISNNRFLLWHDSLEVWKTSPIIGVGFRNIENYTKEVFPDFNYLSSIKSSHNIFIDVLVSQGIIGIVSFIILLITIIIMLLKNYKKDHINTSFAIALFAILFVASLLYPEMLYVNTPSACILWYILGVGRNIDEIK